MAWLGAGVRRFSAHCRRLKTRQAEGRAASTVATVCWAFVVATMA